MKKVRIGIIGVGWWGTVGKEGREGREGFLSFHTGKSVLMCLFGISKLSTPPFTSTESIRSHGWKLEIS